MNISTVDVGIQQINKKCNWFVELIQCNNPSKYTEGNVVSSSAYDITIQIELVDQFYGNDVVVILNDICDHCNEIFYIPDLKPTG